MAEIVHIRPELQRRKPIVRAEVLRRIFEEHELFEDTTILLSVLKMLMERIKIQHAFMNENHTWHELNSPEDVLLMNMFRTVRALIKSADAIGKLPKDSNNYTNERSVCFAEEGTRILQPIHALVRHLASEMDRKALARVVKEVKHNETR